MNHQNRDASVLIAGVRQRASRRREELVAKCAKASIRFEGASKNGSEQLARPVISIR